MVDLATQDLENAVDAEFEHLVDQVVDEDFTATLDDAHGPEQFRVAPDRLTAASNHAESALPGNLRMQMLASASLRSRGIVAASESGAAAAAAPGIDSDAVVAEADQSKRSAAADKIRDLICGQMRQWFDDNLETLRGWIADLGLAGAVKKLGTTGKLLVVGAVQAIAGVVGAAWLAWLLVGVAVAAVAAAIYFLVRNGLPNYCEA